MQKGTKRKSEEREQRPEINEAQRRRPGTSNSEDLAARPMPTSLQSLFDSSSCTTARTTHSAIEGRRLQVKRRQAQAKARPEGEAEQGAASALSSENQGPQVSDPQGNPNNGGTDDGAEAEDNEEGETALLARDAGLSLKDGWNGPHNGGKEENRIARTSPATNRKQNQAARSCKEEVADGKVGPCQSSAGYLLNRYSGE